MAEGDRIAGYGKGREQKRKYKEALRIVADEHGKQSLRNSGTVNNIVIRGLNVDNGANGDIMLNAVPTVATYYDNTPLFANFLVKNHLKCSH